MQLPPYLFHAWNLFCHSLRLGRKSNKTRLRIFWSQTNLMQEKRPTGLLQENLEPTIKEVQLKKIHPLESVPCAIPSGYPYASALPLHRSPHLSISTADRFKIQLYNLADRVLKDCRKTTNQFSKLVPTVYEV